MQNQLLLICLDCFGFLDTRCSTVVGIGSGILEIDIFFANVVRGKGNAENDDVEKLLAVQHECHCCRMVYSNSLRLKSSVRGLELLL